MVPAGAWGLMPRNKSELVPAEFGGLNSGAMLYGYQTKKHFVSIIEHPNGAVTVELVNREHHDAPVHMVINGVDVILEPHHRRAF